MKRRRKKLRLVESVNRNDLMRIDQCGEIGGMRLNGAVPPVEDPDGGADSMHVHGSLFLSLQFQVDSNTKTLNTNQIQPPRFYSSYSAPPSGSRKRGKPKSRSKPFSDPNNVSVSGLVDETLMTKRPKGRPRKNGSTADASEAQGKRRGRPCKFAWKEDASLAITREVHRGEYHGELSTKHQLLRGKIKEAAELLRSAASAIKEFEDIAAMDAD